MDTRRPWIQMECGCRSLRSAKSSKLCISVCKSDCSCSWKNIVQTEVEPGPESSDALKLQLCTRGYRRAVQNKPLMQTQSSCGIEPPNSWGASLEPWPASFHYLVPGGRIEPGQSVNIWIIDGNLKSKEIRRKKRRYLVKNLMEQSTEWGKIIFSDVFEWLKDFKGGRKGSVSFLWWLD